VKALGIKAQVHGVRYPKDAIASLASGNINYAGWLPNYEVPQVFSRFKLTITFHAVLMSKPSLAFPPFASLKR
jgi:spore maturation protein CgeB